MFVSLVVDDQSEVLELRYSLHASGLYYPLHIIFIQFMVSNLHFKRLRVRPETFLYCANFVQGSKYPFDGVSFKQCDIVISETDWSKFHTSGFKS